MKKVILVLLGMMIAVGFAMQASAQNGKVALGLRMTPDGGGFNAQFYPSRHFTVETQLNAGGILNGNNGASYTAVVLFEGRIYMPDPSWQIYLGGGMHGGVWNHGSRRYWNGDFYVRENDSEPVFGLDAIGGVQYKFKRIPLSLSADMKPAINLVEETRSFNHNFFGLSARFHL